MSFTSPRGIDAFVDDNDIITVIGTHDLDTALAAIQRIPCLTGPIEADPAAFECRWYLPICPPHPDSSAEYWPTTADDVCAVPATVQPL